jgi:hypothetical protein
MASLAVAAVAGTAALSQPAEARTFVSVGVGLPVVAAPVYAPVPAYAPAYGYAAPYPAYYPYAPYAAVGFAPRVWFGGGWGWHHGWHR